MHHNFLCLDMGQEGRKGYRRVADSKRKLQEGGSGDGSGGGIEG